MMINNMDYFTCEDINKTQTDMLRTTISYLFTHSSFYKDAFIKRGINASLIKSLDDIIKFPVVTKSDLLESNNDFFCCSLPNASDIVTTSGSTGLHPIVHPLTKSDLERLAFNEQKSFIISDITSKDVVMLTTALDGSFVAGLAYYLGIERIGASIIRAGSKSMNIQAEILSRFPISTIIGVPSNLIKLYNYCVAEGIEIENFNITKLVLIGEAIRNKNFSLNQLGKRLSEYYSKAILYSTYANTETCTSFCECFAGKGGHLHPDLAYVEILDENGRRVLDGTAGRLVITTFSSQGMPLLRYDTGDITFVINEKCICGRTTQRIGPILGRQQNILKINGITLTQMQIENAVLSVKSIDDYCIKIQNNSDGIQEITIYFTSTENNIDYVSCVLKQVIWESTRISVRIINCDDKELIKMQNSTESRKPLRFIHLNNGEENE